MEHSYPAAFSQTASHSSRSASLQPGMRPPEGTQLPTRKYDLMYLDHTGQLREKSMIARAHASFDQAFCVIKQGAIVKSEHGFVSVEDVYPGDRLQLANGTYETVKWRGAITIDPFVEDPKSPCAGMTRITADALGYNRPSPDLVLGHGARILHRAAGIKRVSGSEAAFIPAADFIDGNNVLSLLPATSVNMMQFGFNHQQSLMVNGVEIETLHPGSAFNLGLRGSSLRAFMSLFPHKYSFEDFGLMRTPRLRLRDLDLLS